MKIYQTSWQMDEVSLILIETSLLKTGFATEQAHNDAGTPIISITIHMSSSLDFVIIVGKDIEPLVLLLRLARKHRNVFFQNEENEELVYDSYSFKHCVDVSKNLLFFHAFSGSDIIALYNIRKTKFTSRNSNT